MPNNETAKTKSAPKTKAKNVPRWFWVVLAVCVTTVVLLASLFAARRQGIGCSLSIPARHTSRSDFLRSSPPRDCIYLERVSDQASRALGLAKYDSLPLTHGMLFVFDTPSEACMWMKDMKFAIDMVWLDEQQQVIKIERSVPPESYPHTFCADSPAKYVIELASGVADQAGITVGQQLSL